MIGRWSGALLVLPLDTPLLLAGHWEALQLVLCCVLVLFYCSTCRKCTVMWLCLIIHTNFCGIQFDPGLDFFGIVYILKQANSSSPLSMENSFQHVLPFNIFAYGK